MVLTHGHADHCLDLLPLVTWLRFDAPDHWGIPVYAPPGVMAALAAFAGAGPDHDFHRIVPSHPVGAGDRIAVADLVLDFGAVTHPVPAVCVRVGADGRSLTYTGDTGPGGGVADLAAGTDVLLCEATQQGEPTVDRYPYHLHAAEAGALAAACGARRLLLTHLGPTLDPEVSVAEASAVFTGPVAHAVPGMEVRW